MRALAIGTLLTFVATWANADRYVVEIPAGNARVAHVTATLTPVEGRALHLVRSAADTGLYHGWATFLHDIEVLDTSGAALPVRFVAPGRWELETAVDGAVTARYTMLLQHDRFPNDPGSDELAWAHDEVAFWTGRALFLEGEAASEIEVRFDLPAEWRASTPWEVVEAGKAFRVATTDALLDGGFIAGRHTEIPLGAAHDPRVRIALAGPNAESARAQVSETVERYLGAFTQLMGGPPKDRMLLVAGDGGFWGGGVMGTTISMMVGGALDASTLPMLSFVTVHEMFHLWNANFPYADEAAAQSLYWLSEGTATYYTIRAQLGHGDLPEPAALGQIAAELGKYAAARGELSMAAAGAEKLSNYDLIYSGGLAACLVLDMAIRTGSDDRFSLDDVMSALAADDADPIDLSSLVALVRELTGVDVSPIVATAIEGTEPLPLETALTALGLDYDPERGSIEPDTAPSQGAAERFAAWPIGR